MTTPINDLLGFVDAYVKETEGIPAHECPERDVMKELAAGVRRLTNYDHTLETTNKVGMTTRGVMCMPVDFFKDDIIAVAQHESACRVANERLIALENRLHELTTLRPMSEAPEDEDVLAIALTGMCEQVYVKGKRAFGAQGIKPIGVYKGWLPLPEVKA